MSDAALVALILVVGMFALMAIGVSVADSILLCTFAEKYRRQGMTSIDAAVEAGRAQLADHQRRARALELGHDLRGFLRGHDLEALRGQARAQRRAVARVVLDQQDPWRRGGHRRAPVHSPYPLLGA